jgi:hypothetical protein
VLLLEFISYLWFFYYAHVDMENTYDMRSGLIAASLFPGAINVRGVTDTFLKSNEYQSLKKLRDAAKEDEHTQKGGEAESLEQRRWSRAFGEVVGGYRYYINLGKSGRLRVLCGLDNNRRAIVTWEVPDTIQTFGRFIPAVQQIAPLYHRERVLDDERVTQP